MQKRLILALLLLSLIAAPIAFAQEGPTLDASHTWESRGFSISYPSAWNLNPTIETDTTLQLSSNTTALTITYTNLFDIYLGYGDQILSATAALIDVLAEQNSITRFSIEVVETDYGLLAYSRFDTPANSLYGIATINTETAFVVQLQGAAIDPTTASAIFESIVVNPEVLVMNASVDGGTIAVGASVQGEIAEAPVAYTLSATAGQVISLEAFATDPTLLDTTLTLLADGEEIAFNDDGFTDGTFNSRIEAVTLPPADTYSILVAGFDQFSAGEFTLVVIEGATGEEAVVVAVPDTSPLDGGSIGSGESVRGEIGDRDVSYTLNALAGQTVTIEMIADDPFALDTTLRLLGDGQVISFNDDGYDDGTFNSRIYSFTLPQAATFSIVASRYSEDFFGSYTLSVSEAQPIPEFIDGGNVGIGQTVVGEITASPVHYNLIAEPGQTVTISMTADPTSNLDPLLILLADGEIVNENDDITDDDINSRIEGFVLPFATTYTIVATRYTGIEPAAFTVTVNSGN